MTNGKTTIRNARICFPNFAGRADRYNKAGDRNFSIRLTEDQAREIEEQEFYIRRKEFDDGRDPAITLKVNVSYRGYSAPKIVVIDGNNHTEFGMEDQDHLYMIDNYFMSGEVEKVDVRFTQYRNKNRTDSYGYSAYLDTIFITLFEDPLQAEYAAIMNNGDYNNESSPF